MAILSRNGNPIEQNNYNVNDGIIHIEFGSGDTCFGKREYPRCYLTDLKIPAKQHFMQCLPDYENVDCHYIDFECDFYNHNFDGRLFEKIILCNPYNFGCYGLIEGQIFFNRLGELLNNGGQVIIICNKTNPFASKRKVQSFLDNVDFRSRYEFQINEILDIDETHIIRQDYNFKYCCLLKNATPDQLIIINKIGTDNDDVI